MQWPNFKEGAVTVPASHQASCNGLHFPHSSATLLDCPRYKSSGVWCSSELHPAKQEDPMVYFYLDFEGRNPLEIVKTGARPPQRTSTRTLGRGTVENELPWKPQTGSIMSTLFQLKRLVSLQFHTVRAAAWAAPSKVMAAGLPTTIVTESLEPWGPKPCLSFPR